LLASVEEVDLALNLNPFMAGKQEIKINNRLIMNFYTAKRLLSALAATMQRHESTFGVIELDLNRRVNQLPGGRWAASNLPEALVPRGLALAG
jgi:Protein of unknown function (DUF3467)